MKKIDYTIVFVSDMKRAVEFYRDVLGLPLKFESPDWTEFATEGSTLALHGKAKPAPSSAPDRMPAGTCCPGFVVEDIDAFHQQVTASRARCIQPPKTEEFGGRLAGYADPDGLPISVWEPPKR